MKTKFATAIRLLKESAKGWSDDNAQILGAALSYYSIFSIAPLLILAIAVAGAIFGAEAAQGQISQSLEGLIGKNGAEVIEAMVKAASSKPGTGLIATIIGTVTLLIGASTVFAQLQAALNIIWKVKPKPESGLKQLIKDRFLSFGMVLGISFLLLVSLLLSTVLAVVGNFLSHLLPGGAILWEAVNFLISVGVITTLFAMIFKFLPDAIIAWRDVWIGSFCTSVLFTLGKFAIGLYLGHGSVASAYGAAGSLVIVLVWIFYSSQILLFGAEFTRAYAIMSGSHIVPKKGATFVGLNGWAAPQEHPESHLNESKSQNSSVKLIVKARKSVNSKAVDLRRSKIRLLHTNLNTQAQADKVKKH